MEKLILIDSNSLINRAFYAMPIMTTKNGITTNAILGFLNMLNRLIIDEKPTHIACVFDLRAPTFRHKMCDYYKGTRKGMPDELAVQLPILKDLLKFMNIKILSLEGYEADDVIGTIAKRFDNNTIIVSGDRDVLQLVDDTTRVFHTKRGVSDMKIYDLAKLAEENLTPQKIIEYKGIAGDASDNIKGAKGVGDKTTVTLLDSYGDIDGIYSHIDEIKGKLKDRLLDSKEDVYLSKKLATICIDAPIECDFEDMKFEKKFEDGFFTLLKDLELNSAFDKYSKLIGQTDIVVEDIKKPIFDFKKVTISNLENLESTLKQVNNVISFDFGESINFSFDGTTSYEVALSETLFDEGVSFSDAILLFKNIFESDSINKIAFDIKSIKHSLEEYKINLNFPYDDILLQNYLIDVNRVQKNAKELINYLDLDADYLGASIFVAKNIMFEKMEKLFLLDLYNNTEIPLINVLYNMESEGFLVNLDILNELSSIFAGEINALTEEIYRIAGEKFNINSNQQLGKILTENLKIHLKKKTKTGFSVSADVLEELDHPIVTNILNYRQRVKLQSTYIEGMRAVMNKSTHKVHTIFKQCLTATGRLSSTEPNLQNIPIRTDLGKEIRRMFIPSEGNILVSGDYSQIELRLLAHFSNDPILIEAFNKDIDIHSITASKVFKKPLEDVMPNERRMAKAVNFGIIYGISSFGLARNIGSANYQAKEFIDAYFNTYPNVKDYMDKNAKFAETNGYIRTIFNRIRYFEEFKSPNANIRNFAKRSAMNMPLQGSASDIIKKAMIEVFNSLKAQNLTAKLILQVHDELIIDCPKSEVEIVSSLLKETMTNVAKLSVPLTVDVGVGENWLEC